MRTVMGLDYPDRNVLFEMDDDVFETLSWVLLKYGRATMLNVFDMALKNGRIRRLVEADNG